MLWCIFFVYSRLMSSILLSYFALPFDCRFINTPFTLHKFLITEYRHIYYTEITSEMNISSLKSSFYSYKSMTYTHLSMTLSLISVISTHFFCIRYIMYRAQSSLNGMVHKSEKISFQENVTENTKN